MMKTSLKCSIFGSILAIAQVVSAQTTIFHDDFEGGNLNNWTASGTSPLAIANNQNCDPSGGSFSAYASLSLNRMHHNIVGNNGGFEIGGASSFTTWIYDGTMTRAYAQVLGYSGGTGLPNGGTTASGTMAQLLAIGKYSSVTMPGEVYDATKYQARILYPSTLGWFNLNAPGAPSRSAGWHKFTVSREADGTTIDFYVDDILGRTIAGATAETWDTITLGFGTSSTSNGDTWYDGVSVVVVPEPSSLAFGLLLGTGLVWRVVTRRSRI